MSTYVVDVNVRRRCREDDVTCRGMYVTDDLEVVVRGVISREWRWCSAGAKRGRRFSNGAQRLKERGSLLN
jgi:hypothetical protein